MLSELKGRYSLHVKIYAFRSTSLFHFHAVTALIDLILYLIPSRNYSDIVADRIDTFFNLRLRLFNALSKFVSLLTIVCCDIR